MRFCGFCRNKHWLFPIYDWVLSWFDRHPYRCLYCNGIIVVDKPDKEA